MSQIALDDSSPCIIDMPEGNYNNINKEYIYLYNNFLLERITNINFLVSLYKWEKNCSELEKEICSALLNFTTSPLLNTRLKIIELCQKITPENSDESRLLSIFLKEFHLHQILCTIPITSFVFKYLIELKEKTDPESLKIQSSKNQEKYILKNKDNFLFFKKDSNSLAPSYENISDFKSYVNKEDFQKFFSDKYKCFAKETDYLNRNHLFSTRLVDIWQRLIPAFIEENLIDAFTEKEHAIYDGKGIAAMIRD